ncbi:alkane hydroxylase MAH1-like [Arachis ipaensis]|uniref:alkane hydroxylase MAH1-like n=1 Tax=Arachis ipaensis TaxID=130454 RepID=UPI0007AF869C|nr:alkane hydroxylase MAH1-like [Arachis ipaensis]
MAMLFFYAATIASIIITIILLVLHVLDRKRSCKDPLFIDWPLFGMSLQLFYNLSQIHDFLANVLNRKGGTAEFMGPWFTNMNFLLSTDPMNAHHVFSKNFENYVKGPEFRDVFDVFGDAIIVTDDLEKWRYMKSFFLSLIKHKGFDIFFEKTIQNKVKNSLLPMLDHAWLQGTVLDLQDVFCRFTFDFTSLMVLGFDPKSLSLGFPTVEAEKAFDEIEKCLFYRQMVPKSVWKFQEWLQIGNEKKMAKALKVFDHFLCTQIASKLEELSKTKKTMNAKSDKTIRFGSFLAEATRYESLDAKLLRDYGFNFFAAGRDTIASVLTWFFWLVASHPVVEAKILEEIDKVFGAVDRENYKILSTEDVKKLVYLHGALCEVLRLFPPIPMERKKPIKDEDSDTNIIFSFYAMGRSEEIWGKDCLEFKPERWMNEKGGIVHVPSYKFISFNAGPRTCLGKDMSFIQIKIVTSAILQNYRVRIVKDHSDEVTPTLSIILLMKHGLKVKITKRQA